MAIHFFGWLLVFLLFVWAFWGEKPDHPICLAVMITLVCMAVFYGHYYSLTRYRKSGNVGEYLMILTLILLVGPFSYMLAFDLESQDGNLFSIPSLPTFIVALVFVIISWIASSTEDWFIKALKRETIEKQAYHAELMYLKSQINPHFLFNTLNNIHTLAYKQSPATPDAIMRMASLMRYMIYESNSNTVTLSREINYLQNFISLQQLRYKNDSIVALEITGNSETCGVAPLLFIHLVENAYKHSHAQLNTGDIRIKIEIKESTLTFRIQNPLGSVSPAGIQEPGGIGLINIKKRLQLLYPERHSFEIKRENGFFIATLKIDCHQVLNSAGNADMLYSR